MKFSFIHAEKAEFSVSALCRVLGVTRQGYYAFAKRPMSARVEDEIALQQRVSEVFAEHEGRYGSPRVLRTLRRQGLNTSKRRIERAMRGLGLYARRRSRSRVITTKANAAHRIERNVLARDFTATRPNERWVTDISYVWTDEGWCYLAAILDLFACFARSRSPVSAEGDQGFRRITIGRFGHHDH